EGYVRSSKLGACIDILMTAGGRTRNDTPGVLEVVRDCPDRLAALLDETPELIRRPLPALLLGNTLPSAHPWFRTHRPHSTQTRRSIARSVSKRCHRAP